MAKRNIPATTKRKAPEVPPPPWNAKRAALVAASGWVVAVLLGLLELPAKVNSFFNEAPAAYKNVSELVMPDQQWSGVWTSDLEGVVDATDDERNASVMDGSPVVLRLRVYHGAVAGELYSGGLEKNYVSSRVMIEGHKRLVGGTIDAVVYDYIDTKKTPLAQFELTLDDSARLPLRLTAVRQGLTFLPKTISLYRNDDAFPDDLGGPNVDFIEKAAKQFAPDPAPAVESADQKKSQ